MASEKCLVVRTSETDAASLLNKLTEAGVLHVEFTQNGTFVFLPNEPQELGQESVREVITKVRVYNAHTRACAVRGIKTRSSKLSFLILDLLDSLRSKEDNKDRRKNDYANSTKKLVGWSDRKKEKGFVLPTDIKPWIEYWNSKNLRSHKLSPSLVITKSIAWIRKLQDGTLYSESTTPDIPTNFYNQAFTLKDFQDSLTNFDKAANDSGVFPRRKDSLKRLSLPEFLYWPECRDENKSPFLYYLLNEPRPINAVTEENPALTQALIESYRASYPLPPIVTQAMRNYFILAANNTHSVFRELSPRLINPMTLKQQAYWILNVADKTFRGNVKVPFLKSEHLWQRVREEAEQKLLKPTQQSSPLRTKSLLRR